MADTDLIDIDEARRAVGLRESQINHDEDLQDTFIPAITPIVEDVRGPVVRRPFTFVGAGGRSAVLLPYAIHSVTSVTVAGQALAADGYTANLEAGIVYSGGPINRTVFAGGAGDVVVQYVVGVCDDTASVPANVKLAARLILKSTFGAHTGYQAEDSEGKARMVQTPSGYWIPSEAHALLIAGDTDDLLQPGFA